MMAAWLLWMALGAAPAERAPDTIVVAPREYLDALQPWLAFRTQQGRRLAYVSAGGSADEIRADIRRSAEGGAVRWIVLVGDALPARPARPGDRPSGFIPAKQVAAKINVKWGSEPEIATDNWYADFDDDDLPDAAIGRLAVDSPAELSAVTAKILAYEQRAGFGAWRHRINFVAGVGGFGALVDTVLESTTRKFLCDGIPAAYSTSMTYGSWRSPYCPDPRRFHEATVERLSEGCLFWVYIGHGAPTQLDRVQTPGGQFPILGAADMSKLRGQASPPIAILLACYTGAYDQPRDCLAEEMLRAPGGPVAVLAGSRVTMPYAMAILGNGLIDECFQQRRATLGEMLQHAKRRLMADDQNDTNRQLMDAIAAAVSPAPDQLIDERREHLHLFNLIGDPLLTIRHPDELRLAELDDVDAGRTIEIQGDSNVTGRCLIELVCRRDRFKFEPPARSKFETTQEFLAALHDTYRRANDRSWISLFAELEQKGRFVAPLEIPAEASGPCHVRVHVEGRDAYALGSTNLFVRRPRPQP